MSVRVNDDLVRFHLCSGLFYFLNSLEDDALKVFFIDGLNCGKDGKRVFLAVCENGSLLCHLRLLFCFVFDVI